MVINMERIYVPFDAAGLCEEDNMLLEFSISLGIHYLFKTMATRTNSKKVG
jgi:hypothetical protein